MRVGLGYDIHRLVPGYKLILGGVAIPFEKGLLGHSDADVLVHAAMDALLGAAGLGDIGIHFPDSDPAFKGACSLDLLRQVCAMVAEKGLRVVNLDATLFAERPKLAPHRHAMAAAMADIMKIDSGRINLKATTTEGLGPVGRGEGIGAMCVVMLVRDGGSAAS
jgi:2-C-methyl-D-erythritol 2,4-cyclodiphosphate synthase